MFKRQKPVTITIKAPLRYSPPEDQHKGWIRVSEELRGGIENGSYIEVRGKEKSVYCQIRGTPRKTGIIQMNEYYRAKFGWENPKKQVEITIGETGFWGKLRAIQSHPDSLVRVGFGLGCISVGLGCISVCFAGLAPSITETINPISSNATLGISGLTASFIFVGFGIIFIVAGIRSMINR